MLNTWNLFEIVTAYSWNTSVVTWYFSWHKAKINSNKKQRNLHSRKPCNLKDPVLVSDAKNLHSCSYYTIINLSNLNNKCLKLHGDTYILYSLVISTLQRLLISRVPPHPASARSSLDKWGSWWSSETFSILKVFTHKIIWRFTQGLVQGLT